MVKIETLHDGLLTTKEAAAWLRISSRHLQNLAKRGAIPRIKLGASARYDRRDLQAYADSFKLTSH